MMLSCRWSPSPPGLNGVVDYSGRPHPPRRRLLGFHPIEEAAVSSPNYDVDREYQLMMRGLLLFTATFTLILVVMLTLGWPYPG